jgi:hypothetical protein
MQELLQACGTGFMPRVRRGTRIGTVQAIKLPSSRNNAKQHNGCAVLFDGENYEVWYHNSDETDKRRVYMRDLEIVTITL